MSLTADGQTVMENKYSYDAVDNILGITNAANPTSLMNINKAKLGGRSAHSYQYDELNRLISAKGKAQNASYSRLMSVRALSKSGLYSPPMMPHTYHFSPSLGMALLPLSQ